MRKFIIIAVVFWSVSGGISSLCAQGIEFFEGSWEEALALAQEKEKLIFVDCYAEWCGPCKRMAAQVFPDPNVGEFFNENFINLKWDMEKGKGLEFRKTYPVSAFPTLYFIDPEGEVVVNARGARDIPGLISLGKEALASFNPYADFSDLYSEGDRSPETVFHHFQNLKREGQNIRPMANDYFRSQADFSDEFNIRLLALSVEEADSRLFDLLIEHRETADQIVGSEEINDIIMEAGWNTVSKAMNYREPFLLDEATGKINASAHPNARSFELRAPIYYSIQVRDAELYRGNMELYLSELGGAEEENAIELFDLGMRFFGDQTEFVDFMEKNWRALSRGSENPELHYRNAQLQLKLDNHRQASRFIMRAIDLLDEEDERREIFEQFRQKLN